MSRKLERQIRKAQAPAASAELDQLKVMAYDTAVQVQLWQQRSQAINARIVELAGRPALAVAAAPPPPESSGE